MSDFARAIGLKWPSANWETHDLRVHPFVFRKWVDAGHPVPPTQTELDSAVSEMEAADVLAGADQVKKTEDAASAFNKMADAAGLTPDEKDAFVWANDAKVPKGKNK